MKLTLSVVTASERCVTRLPNSSISRPWSSRRSAAGRKVALWAGLAAPRAVDRGCAGKGGLTPADAAACAGGVGWGTAGGGLCTGSREVSTCKGRVASRAALNVSAPAGNKNSRISAYAAVCAYFTGCINLSMVSATATIFSMWPRQCPCDMIEQNDGAADRCGLCSQHMY